MTEASPKTITIIILFACWYLYRIVRKTAVRQLDLYDFSMLSTVAVIPAFFVLFPEGSITVTHLMGVEFPFVILFGILLAVLFIFIHRMTVRLHRVESDNRLLIQEISLLRQVNENTTQNKQE